MDQHAENSAMERLAALIGEWSMEARFKDIPPADASARAVFEWMPGQRFLIERWEVPVPEAPDGIAASRELTFTSRPPRSVQCGRAGRTSPASPIADQMPSASSASRMTA